MKSTLASLIIFACLFTTLVTRSQTPDKDLVPPALIHAERPQMIRIQAEFIEMRHPAYTKLMAESRTSANDSDLRESCHKLIEAGEAKIIQSLSVNVLPGKTAITEDIQEFIFPIEADRGSRPTQIAPGTQKFRAPYPRGPSTPPAFDTKNVGSTFEIEAQLDAQSTLITLRFTPTIIHHVATDVWGKWQNDEVKVETAMPRFYVLAVKTGINLLPGQTQMVAALSPQNNDGWMDSSRKVMTFIRADLITTGP